MHKEPRDDGRRFKQVSVIGAGDCKQTSEVALLAEQVGRGLAEAGVTVVAVGSAG